MNNKKKTVMLVDDSPVIQTLVKKIFFGLGIDVIGLKTGNKVLDTIKDNDIDAIILDIILPDADGIEIAKQVRKLKDGKKSSIPIIAISGNYKNYTEKDFKELGIEYYLIKPLDYDKLVGVVQKSVN